MEEVIKTQRKVKKGVVVSNKMDKTVIVRCARTMKHPRYHKVVTRFKKFYAHYDNASKPLNIGDEVTIIETRPLSKLKRWRVVA
jgi:small subunit ribosomal protein S17